MKLKTKISENKNTILLATLGLVGGYLYLTQDKEEGMFGGFGGGGGIPLLPGDTEGAAEDDTIINYILPTPEVAPVWDDESRFDMKKAQVVIDKYERLYAPAQTAYEKSIALGAPTAADVAAYGKSKKADQTPKADIEAPWYAPWTWDWSKAAEGYQEWSSASTARLIGKDPLRRSGVTSSKKADELMRAVTAAKTAAIVHKANIGITKPYRSYGGGGLPPTSVRIGSATSKKSVSQKLSKETAAKTTMRRKSGYGGYI